MTNDSRDLHALHCDQIKDLIRTGWLQLDPDPVPSLIGFELATELVIDGYRRGARPHRDHVVEALRDGLADVGSSAVWSDEAAIALCAALQGCGDELVPEVRAVLAGKRLLTKYDSEEDRQRRRERHCMLLKVLLGLGSKESPEFWIDQWHEVRHDAAALVFVALAEHGLDIAFDRLPELLENEQVARCICHAFANLVHEHGWEEVRRRALAVEERVSPELWSILRADQPDLLSEPAPTAGAGRAAARGGEVEIRPRALLDPPPTGATPLELDQAGERNRRAFDSIVIGEHDRSRSIVLLGLELGEPGSGGVEALRDADVVEQIHETVGDCLRERDSGGWMGGGRFGFVFDRAAVEYIPEVLKRLSEELLARVDRADVLELRWRYALVDVAAEEQVVPRELPGLLDTGLSSADWTPLLDDAQNWMSEFEHFELLTALTDAVRGLRRLATEHPDRFYRVPIKKFLNVYVDLISELESTYARDEEVSKEDVAETMSKAAARFRHEFTQ